MQVLLFQTESNTMRLTSKGQVTIPKELRERLALAPGDEVEFRLDADRVVIQRANGKGRPRAADEIISSLESMGRNLDRVPMTTDELMALTRGPFNDLDAH